MAELEKIDSNLPAIIPDCEEAWIKICKHDFGPRMLRALQRVAGGSSARAAATAEGYGTATDVYRHCKSAGLINTKTKFIIDKHAAVASLSGAELERRLLEAPDDVTTRDLTVINGVATDKILAYEKNAKNDGADYMSALEQVAAKVAASGASLELKVTVKPAVEDIGTLIDVTPQEETTCSQEPSGS